MDDNEKSNIVRFPTRNEELVERIIRAAQRVVCAQGKWEAAAAEEELLRALEAVKGPWASWRNV